jgi:hypothetical protein
MKKNQVSQESPKNAEPAKEGILKQVGESVKENIKVEPSEITDALIRDAKQAVNYEIRKGMRGLINKLFSK